MYPLPQLALPKIFGPGVSQSISASLNETLLNSTAGVGAGNYSTMKRRVSGFNETPLVPLKISSPRDIEEIEKIKDELQMKEQRMVKRYEKYIGEFSRIEEEVRKRNIDRKTQAEIDSV